jgi:ParB-like chromosome segregation protein Spo0J
MAEDPPRLSGKSIAVLEMIAAGSAYDQILAAYPDLTYLGIFAAAQAALDCVVRPKTTFPDRLSVIKASYPRAYEKWTRQEEDKLQKMIADGLTVAQIAGRLQRQRSAIRSRIVRLNLVDEMPPKERARLIRIRKLDPVDADPAAD